ncbi:MAG: flagellar hook assembly protein FlgD [Polyangiaceae bacterium]|nr:flagellar hook assembly protein FlgD [Polyangiaceae bacterium]
MSSVEGEPLASSATAEGLVGAGQAAPDATPSLGAAPAEGPLALGIGVTSRAGQDAGAVATARAPAASGEAVPAQVEAGEDERHRLVAVGINRLALRQGLRAEADVPELGRVSVEARSTAEGTIDLRVSAADPAAAAALGRHQGNLVQTLEASSIPLGRVSIDAQGHGASSFQHAHSQAQSQAQTPGQFQGGGKSGREGTQARPEADRNDDRSARRPGRSRLRVVLLGENTVSVSSLRTTSDNGLLSGTAGSGSSGSSGSAAASAMDKDTFLKLLVAQISHQDPLKPMEGTEFVTQLAQFSAVEQAMQQSQRLELLSAQMSGLANNAATDLVGKTVTLRGKSVAFDGVTATGASVTLGGAAESVKVTVRDASGKAVRTLDLGAKPAGALAVTWDGKDDAGQPVSAGSYSLEVQAKNADGAAIAVSQDVQGVVKGVFFDKGYPEILLDSGVRAPISDLIGVVGQAAPSSP